MGKNPSEFTHTADGRVAVQDIPDAQLKRFPVDSVSWEDAQQFVQALNAQVNEPDWTYRLPSEAEWEYACRGGPVDIKASAFLYYFKSPQNELAPTSANFVENALRRPMRVGSFEPNSLGLYDMHGNVDELCEDHLERDGKSLCISRGGGAFDGADFCRAASNGRQSNSADKFGNLGLRVARVRAGKESEPSTLPRSSAALEALRRDQISPEALKMAGDGDPSKAPASLVGVLGEARPFQNARINGLAYSPDGRWLASASHDKTILLRDADTGRVNRSLEAILAPFRPWRSAKTARRWSRRATTAP